MNRVLILLAALAISFPVWAADSLATNEISSEARPTYRKKVAITRFQVINPLQVEDISDIWSTYPLELLRRLESTGNILPVGSLASLLPDEPSPDSPANREIIRRIAEQSGSQFVVSGVILDAGFGAETLRPYAEWQGGQNGRRFELGFLWNSLAAGIRPEPKERRFDVEVFLHAGYSGALIARRRHNVLVTGQVIIGREKAFASAAFFSTPYGHALEGVLNAQVEALVHELAHQPFEANIVRIEGGRVFIDAGASSSLNPNSRLMIHRRSSAATTGQGMPVVALALDQVQTLSSSGLLEIDPAVLNLQVGDAVRVEALPAQIPAPSQATPG